MRELRIRRYKYLFSDGKTDANLSNESRNGNVLIIKIFSWQIKLKKG
jgi:hypothetical protein